MAGNRTAGGCADCARAQDYSCVSFRDPGEWVIDTYVVVRGAGPYLRVRHERHISRVCRRTHYRIRQRDAAPRQGGIQFVSIACDENAFAGFVNLVSAWYVCANYRGCGRYRGASRVRENIPGPAGGNGAHSFCSRLLASHRVRQERFSDFRHATIRAAYPLAAIRQVWLSRFFDSLSACAAMAFA